MTGLDRPVWAALAAAPHLAEGGVLARRYRPDVNLFASARDDGEDSLAALCNLVRADEAVYVLQVPTIRVPAGLAALREARGVQMQATRPVTPDGGEGTLVDLGDDDAAEMLALAQLTQPGPFLARTHTMGGFVGVRLESRLVAMAGERMRFAGHSEISGVCTHPDARGRGLARRLSAVVAQRIQQRGELPFLHAWTSNRPAIALYESLGFALRAEVHVAVLQRAA